MSLWYSCFAMKKIPVLLMDAHRALADTGLAPRLRYCSKVAAGIFMVVIDFVNGWVHVLILLMTATQFLMSTR